MRIAVVFESMYGATHEVADAIAAGAAEAQPDAVITCERVTSADAATVSDADVLIVGGPTHMRGMTSGATRKMAVSIAEKAGHDEGRAPGHGLEPDAEGPGLRNWFHELPKAQHGRWGAAFDTRGEGAMVGGAAKGIAHRLHTHGRRLVADPEGFVVEGSAQQLKAGERERARAWAAAMVRSVAASRATR
jgi:hypothetical protein